MRLPHAVPVALLALAAQGRDDLGAIQTGFIWSTLAMGLVALLGVALALVRPRRA